MVSAMIGNALRPIAKPSFSERQAVRSRTVQDLAGEKRHKAVMAGLHYLFEEANVATLIPN